MSPLAKTLLAAFAFGASATLGAKLQSEGVFGIDKVLDMLDDLRAKAIHGKNDEKVVYARSSTVCKQETSRIDSDIKETATRIKLLDAEIEKLTLEAKGLGEAADKVMKTIEDKSSELELKTTSRSKDHSTFVKKSEDLHESVDQLTRAHAALKSAARDREGAKASAFFQLQGESSLELKAREALLALTSSDPIIGGDNISLTLLARNAEPGAADAYKSQSGGVIQTLETLRDSAAAELKELQTKESKAKRDEELVIQQLKMSITNAKRSRAEKVAAKVQRESKVAFDRKQLVSAKDDKKSTEKLFTKTKSECQAASEEFTNNQETRQDEIDALAHAIGLIGSSNVSTAKKHLDLAQRGLRKASALVQISSVSALREATQSHHRVRLYLEAQARRLRSKSLTLLLEQIAANPFSKVIVMVKDMLARLEKEANQDQTLEEFCDLEVAKNKQSRTQLAEDVEQVTSKIEDAKASLALLKKEIETLTDEIGAVNTARNQSKKLRRDEQDENAGIIKDSKEAAAVVEKAINLLKEFYTKAAAKKPAPTTTPKPLTMSDLFDFAASADPYTGLQAESGGVIAMLEVVLSDFQDAIANAAAADQRSKKRHDEFMVQSHESKTLKEKEVNMRKEDKAALDIEITKNEAALKVANQELTAAAQYAEKLEGKCVQKGTTYTERAAVRQADIQALKEALQRL